MFLFFPTPDGTQGRCKSAHCGDLWMMMMLQAVLLDPLSRISLTFHCWDLLLSSQLFGRGTISVVSLCLCVVLCCSVSLCVVLCCSVCCLSSSCLCSRADDGGPRGSQPELESELLCVVAVGQRLTTLTHLLYPLLPVRPHGRRVRSSYPSMQRGRRRRNTVPFRRRGVVFSSYSCPF